MLLLNCKASIVRTKVIHDDELTVEDKVNAWLRENEDLDILSIQHQATAKNSGAGVWITVLITYFEFKNDQYAQLIASNWVSDEKHLRRPLYTLDE